MNHILNYESTPCGELSHTKICESALIKCLNYGNTLLGELSHQETTGPVDHSARQKYPFCTKVLLKEMIFTMSKKFWSKIKFQV